MQPCTGCGAAVTAAITKPSRSSAAVWSWSSRWRSKQIPRSSGTAASAGRNHVARESAFTAIVSVRVPSSPNPSSPSASCSSWASDRANRTTTWPDSVSRTGFVRSSRTRPVRCSRAFTRWLTADGVTCSTAAAASKLCSSTTASSVLTWSSGRSDITSANVT